MSEFFVHAEPVGIALPAAAHSVARQAHLLPPPAALVARWATSEADVRSAQRLRHRVFVDEMGARLSPPSGTPAGLDIDVFDPYCEHLLVEAVDAHGEAGDVVGTYRVLTPAAARRAGGLYTETEFDLTRLRALRPRMLELGRSCVDPQWRHRGVVLRLWTELAAFMASSGLETMIGCASIGMRDGGHSAASLWHRLAALHLAPIEYRVRPRLPLPLAHLRTDLSAPTPALIHGYLRCGARILGEPAWDPDFGTADMAMFARLEDLPARWRRAR